MRNSTFFFSAFLVVAILGACMRKEESIVPSSPHHLMGYWKSGSTPTRYWVFSETQAIVDSPFDTVSGVYTVRMQAFAIESGGKVMFTGKTETMSYEALLKGQSQLVLTPSAGQAMTLTRMEEVEVKRVFGPGYASEAAKFVEAISTRTYLPR